VVHHRHRTRLRTTCENSQRDSLLLQVCEEQKCQEEVFPLAMNCMDRFLSVCPIKRSQLQLLGCVCLLLSSKLRQPESIPAKTLVELTDNCITVDDLLVSTISHTFPPWHFSYDSFSFTNFIMWLEFYGTDDWIDTVQSTQSSLILEIHLTLLVLKNQSLESDLPIKSNKWRLQYSYQGLV